ncbi:MAG TPA: ABC transporter permease [Pseudonocardiaceae bacterium]|nr:ABC transporter permease [Pseudonocardiaceae bacterium]
MTAAGIAKTPRLILPVSNRTRSVRAFFAILRRDVAVTLKEFPLFLAQVLLQPLFFLLIFAKILTGLGYTSPNYQAVLFPGLVALATTITGIQSTAMALVSEFSWSKEIEDRLLAPLPTFGVSLEKLAFGALRSMIASVIMFPIGIIVLGGVPFHVGTLPLLVGTVIFGSIVGAAIGLTLGTFVPAEKINMMFALVFTPLLFSGSTQYPWLSLGNIRWFQVLSAMNPITYVSEGMRGALSPDIPHIPGLVDFAALVALTLLFSAIGMVGFRRRALS